MLTDSQYRYIQRNFGDLCLSKLPNNKGYELASLPEQIGRRFLEGTFTDSNQVPLLVLSCNLEQIFEIFEGEPSSLIASSSFFYELGNNPYFEELPYDLFCNFPFYIENSSGLIITNSEHGQLIICKPAYKESFVLMLERFDDSSWQLIEISKPSPKELSLDLEKALSESIENVVFSVGPKSLALVHELNDLNPAVISSLERLITSSQPKAESIKRKPSVTEISVHARVQAAKHNRKLSKTHHSGTRIRRQR